MAGGVAEICASGKRWDIVISAKRRVPEAKATFTITPAADFSYTITTSVK